MKNILVFIGVSLFMIISCSGKSGDEAGGGGGVGGGASGPTRIYKINYGTQDKVAWYRPFMRLLIEPVYAMTPQATYEGIFDEDTGRLSKVQNYSGAGVAGSYYTYEYDTDGRMSARRCWDTNDNGATWVIWYQYEYTYNSYHKVASITDKKGDGTVQAYTEYTYDSNGHCVDLSKYSNTSKTTKTYQIVMEYDGDGMLIRAYSAQTGSTERYEFSYEGRTRTQKVYLFATVGDPASGTYAWDNVFTFDEDGNITTAGKSTDATEEVYEYVTEPVAEDKTNGWQKWWDLGNNSSHFIEKPQW